MIDASIMAAGPWTGTLLGELGAEVIKIEPPSGDGTRWVEPSQRGMGTNFICLNVNKQDITLDLKKVEDQAIALDLCANADIFIQNFRGGVIERLGLGYAALKARNPQLIYCSISGFGETGPLAKEACADFIMQAYSGFARLNGRPGDPLEAFRFSGFVDLTTSSVAVEGILAALLERSRTGHGQKVEVSMLQAALEMQFTRMAEILGAGRLFEPMGSQSPGLVPDRVFATLDHGEVFVTVHDAAQWAGFCSAIERPDLVADPRFASNAARVDNRAALDAELEPIFAARPMIWWMRILERHGVACALAQHFEQLRHHAQICANDMVAQIETAWGRLSIGGLPWHFSATPCAVTPPPVPGADTERVLQRLKDGALARKPVAATGRSLTEGLRVVELASGVSGPMAGCRLADLGADVVKLETQDGDWMRGCPPFLADGTSAVFFALNRGKRGQRLAGEDAEQARTLREMLAKADVFITDLSAARLASLGLADAEAARALNPRLIVAQISAFGAHGPLAGKPGSELCAQAMSGYTRYVGTGGEPSIRLGADVGGCSTGIFATQAVLAALHAREASGTGQWVDLSMLNSLLALKTVHLAAQSDPDRFEGPRVGGAYDPPERGWRTADAPITFAFGGSVGAEGRPGWAQFVETVGLSHLLDDPRFDKNGRRTTGLGPAARELKPEYEAGFLTRPSSEVVARVRGFGGLASAYLSHEDLLAEPQVQALDIVRTLPSATGNVNILSYPVLFSDFKPIIRGPLAEEGTPDRRTA
ncbi:MAG: CoA transferase [Bosea sp.]|nr:CoA transferase [Bosea sp. (in: a-proteobacteria)]